MAARGTSTSTSLKEESYTRIWCATISSMPKKDLGKRYECSSGHTRVCVYRRSNFTSLSRISVDPSGQQTGFTSDGLKLALKTVKPGVELLVGGRKNFGGHHEATFEAAIPQLWHGMSTPAFLLTPLQCSTAQLSTCQKEDDFTGPCRCRGMQRDPQRRGAIGYQGET